MVSQYLFFLNTFIIFSKNITESFSRCAKALIKRGVQDGQDEVIGMPFEFVIENNPYDNGSKTGSEIYARLLWEGKPHRFAQITIFNKAARAYCV